MDLNALVESLRAADSGTLVVPPKILRRVIKADRKLGGLGLDVPHAHAYLVRREALFAIAEEAEVGHRKEGLPGSLILLPRPDGGGPEVPLALWRAAFHAQVHRALEARIEGGALTLSAVRAKVHRVGQTEFDEVRAVLRHDGLLLPPHGDVATYVEFVATYLELRVFAPELCVRTFPGLLEVPGVDLAIAEDVDAKALLAACRPAGTPTVDEVLTLAPAFFAELARKHDQDAEDAAAEAEPAVGRRAESGPGFGENLSALVPAAEAAHLKGNLARALLLLTRAASISGPGSEGERAARAELLILLGAVARALDWARPPLDRWADALAPVVRAAPSAARVPWNVEARLVHDLQNATIDAIRETYTVDVLTWARSFGKRPVKRMLPVQKEVRVLARFRAAAKKLSRAHVDDADRAAALHVLRGWVDRAEENLRARVRPRIEEALTEVRLVPTNVPEQVAREKLVDELCDVTVERGFFSIGQLRDALSRNALKMENLAPRELVSGDAVLKTDDRLSVTLDGVYRRGEIYLRFLQRFSAIAFGTRVGRLVTLYVALPLGGAFVGLEGTQHILGALLKYVFGVSEEHEPQLVNRWSFGVTAAVIFLLMHSALARLVAKRLLRVGSFVLRVLFVTVPRFIATRAVVQSLVQSPPVRFFGRYVLKPFVIASLVAALLHWLGTSWPISAGVSAALFVVLDVALNTRAGLMAQEAMVDAGVRNWRALQKRVLPGLWALLVAVFKVMIDGLERFLYIVDEFLRFHRGDSQLTIVVKAALGLVWGIVAFTIRFYVTLLIEPEVNPVKHFPVVTVAAKIMIPMMKDTQELLVRVLEPPFGGTFAKGFAAPTTFFLPGFWGFLTWELKENFKLYRMNRPEHLGAVSIGHHGESMAQYLKPGLHSGTVPKTWTKLRRATRKSARAALKHRLAIHHIEATVRHFAERELSALLEASPRWTGGALAVARVCAASNRIFIDLGAARLEGGALRLTFEEQSGFLVASVARTGFLGRLADDQRAVLEAAIAGFYKMAAVDLVREQIVSCLDPRLARAPYDVSDEGLVVWPVDGYGAEVIYDLHDDARSLRARVRSEDYRAETAYAPLDRQKLFFRDQPISWRAWVDTWSREGAAPPLRGPSILPPKEAPAASAGDGALLAAG